MVMNITEHIVAHLERAFGVDLDGSDAYPEGVHRDLNDAFATEKIPKPESPFVRKFQAGKVEVPLFNPANPGAGPTNVTLTRADDGQWKDEHGDAYQFIVSDDGSVMAVNVQETIDTQNLVFNKEEGAYQVKDAADGHFHEFVFEEREMGLVDITEETNKLFGEK